MKNNQKIDVICFDGLHNVGKSTQIELAKRQLGSMGIHSLIRRGDGSRKGLGIVEEDPISEWWQDNYQDIVDTGVEGHKAELAAQMASRRLGQELLHLCNIEYPKLLDEYHIDRGVVLLNRGPISRLFVSRRLKSDSVPKLYEGDPSYQIAPDHIFVLHADKETLIKRNETRLEGGQQKRDFNANIINKYHNDFSNTLDALPEELAEITTIVDASPDIQSIHFMIMRLILDELGVNHEQR